MSTAINNALSGLLGTQARIDVISRNITNASVDGYTEKTQNVGTSVTGGLMVLGISRNVDSAMQASSRDVGSDINSLGAQIDALTQLEAQFGSPGDGSTLADKIAGLKSSFQALSANPADSSAQQGVLVAAQDVARSFNTLSTSAQTLQSSLANQTAVQASQANALLQGIATMNTKISAIESGNGDPTDLQDQRDQALQQLGGIIGITAFVNNTGQVSIFTKEGQSLLDGSSVHTLVAASNGTGVSVQNGSGALLPLNVTTGTLGGIQQVSATLSGFSSKLDDLAAALTDGLNGCVIPSTPPVTPPTTFALFTQGGSTTPFVRPQTTPATVPPTYLVPAGYAAGIGVNANFINNPDLVRGLTDAGTSPVSGDTSGINLVLSFFDQTNTAFAAKGLPGSGNLGTTAAGAIADVSTLRASLQAQQDQQTTVKQSIDQRIAGQSGVNVDQEFAQMIQLQQSYAANAKVLETVKQMYDTLFAAFQ